MSKETITSGTVTAVIQDALITLTITATKEDWRAVQSTLNDDGTEATQNFWEVLWKYFGDS